MSFALRWLWDFVKISVVWFFVSSNSWRDTFLSMFSKVIVPFILGETVFCRTLNLLFNWCDWLVRRASWRYFIVFRFIKSWKLRFIYCSHKLLRSNQIKFRIIILIWWGIPNKWCFVIICKVNSNISHFWNWS